MDNIKLYKEIVEALILELAQYKPSHGDIEAEAVIDQERGHYEVLHVGWQDDKRVHGSVLHIDVIDGKVWIQYDGTSLNVAEELVNKGVPRDEIVLGFRPPRVRQYTGFAIA